MNRIRGGRARARSRRWGEESAGKSRRNRNPFSLLPLRREKVAFARGGGEEEEEGGAEAWATGGGWGFIPGAFRAEGRVGVGPDRSFRTLAWVVSYFPMRLAGILLAPSLLVVCAGVLVCGPVFGSWWFWAREIGIFTIGGIRGLAGL